MKVAQETGKVPTAVATRPQLDLLEARYWDAFQVLHAGRGSTGFGPAPVLLSEVLAYATIMEIDDPEDRRDLMHIIRAMDRSYIEQASKK